MIERHRDAGIWSASKNKTWKNLGQETNFLLIQALQNFLPQQMFFDHGPGVSDKRGGLFLTAVVGF